MNNISEIDFNTASCYSDGLTSQTMPYHNAPEFTQNII